MSRKCDICGKGSVAGRSLPRKGLPKKKGGAGQHIGVKSRRFFRPNIQKVRARINGSPALLKVCTRCLKAGKVVKA